MTNFKKLRQQLISTTKKINKFIISCFPYLNYSGHDVSLVKKKKNFLGKIKQKVFFLNLYDGNVINQFCSWSGPPRKYANDRFSIVLMQRNPAASVTVKLR